MVINRPPTEFLPKRPPPAETIFNIYKLKTQPELVRYHHASAGFPTKPTWSAAIKNKQYTSWPGLTAEGVRRHFPHSEKTHKGHGRKTPSGLRSTKLIAMDNDDDFDFNRQNERPIKKEKTIFIHVVYMEDKATQKMWTDQTGQFPKKSSKGNQYIMVLTESDSDTILVKPMKNRTSGEMIRTYQTLVEQLCVAGIAPKRTHPR